MNQKVENELGGFIDPHSSYWTSGSDLAPQRELVKRGPERRRIITMPQDPGTVRVVRAVKPGEVLQVRMRATDRRRIVSQAERDMLVPEKPVFYTEHSYPTEESAGDMLRRLGIDGKLWAEEMHQRFPSIPEDELLGWCCNMIMAGYDEAQRRHRKSAKP